MRRTGVWSRSPPKEHHLGEDAPLVEADRNGRRGRSFCRCQATEHLMRAILHRSFTIFAIALAATLFAGGMSRADEKAEEGVKLEFWKGHFNRGAASVPRLGQGEGSPGGLCALPRRQQRSGISKRGQEHAGHAARQERLCLHQLPCRSADLCAAHGLQGHISPAASRVDTGNNDANLCMTCHQGRESTASVNKAIAGLPLDKPEPKLNFLHVHYYPGRRHASTAPRPRSPTSTKARAMSAASRTCPT